MINMPPEQENACYAEPDNQVPQGPPVRRTGQARRARVRALPRRTPTRGLRSRGPQTTDRSPTGSDERSSMNSPAAEADHD